ncbi:tyrosinase [Aspergillus terreus]|uniref:Tyrosinase n=1 Tax=Aspergillus terreus TaxID=33178 RepID=A0A5M3YLB8_ASPTE|nr:hypothetical protein ATETN484_0001031100 [Aspergillus terreus]GFF12167.1 tyrosinase [Aspergillus terreus]
MRTLSYAVVALAAVQSALAAKDSWDVLAAKALHNQVAHYHTTETNSTCTPQTASVRREWGSLSKPERREYIDAVLCLASRPSQSDPAIVPGARNRYDDFVAVHINQTHVIHGTGNFLTWHRYFTWAYEQALRDECDYAGDLPYWAWNKYAADPLHSPVFDGSPYSMSGDGTYIPHNATEAAPGFVIAAGHGGGCVDTGPFKNWTVNLGPVNPTLQVPRVVAQNGSGLEYNPRCLRRDISTDAARWTATPYVLDLIVNKTTITTFQNDLQGDFPKGLFGVHAGGHFTIGGDPGGDFFASPGDPVFFLHHAAIDRLYWTWQNQAPASRKYVVDGPTVGNDPTSRDTTLDDVVDMSLGKLAEPKMIRELVDTLSGPFCYVYA